MQDCCLLSFSHMHPSLNAHSYLHVYSYLPVLTAMPNHFSVVRVSSFDILLLHWSFEAAVIELTIDLPCVVPKLLHLLNYCQS